MKLFDRRDSNLLTFFLSVISERKRKSSFQPTTDKNWKHHCALWRSSIADGTLSSLLNSAACHRH